MFRVVGRLRLPPLLVVPIFLVVRKLVESSPRREMAPRFRVRQSSRLQRQAAMLKMEIEIV